MDTEINIIGDESFYIRLLEEYSQVNERIDKLISFLSKVDESSIQPLQFFLLKIQLQAMQTYRQCLKLRIDLLNETNFDILTTKTGIKLKTLSKEELKRKNKTIK